MKDYWGPKAWCLLHQITYHYPENPTQRDKVAFSMFFNRVVPWIIPCRKCRMHYFQHLTNRPIHLSLKNRHKLTKWMVDIHNSVNVKTGKRIHFSLKQSDKKYQYQNNQSEIIKFLLYLKQRVHYGQINLLAYNQLVVFLQRVFPFSVH